MCPVGTTFDEVNSLYKTFGVSCDIRELNRIEYLHDTLVLLYLSFHFISNLA